MQQNEPSIVHPRLKKTHFELVNKLTQTPPKKKTKSTLKKCLKVMKTQTINWEIIKIINYIKLNFRKMILTSITSFPISSNKINTIESQKRFPHPKTELVDSWWILFVCVSAHIHIWWLRLVGRWIGGAGIKLTQHWSMRCYNTKAWGGEEILL